MNNTQNKENNQEGLNRKHLFTMMTVTYVFGLVSGLVFGSIFTYIAFSI